MAEDIIIKIDLDGAQEQLNELNLLQEAINSLATEKRKLAATEKAVTKEIDDSIREANQL